MLADKHRLQKIGAATGAQARRYRVKVRFFIVFCAILALGDRAPPKWEPVLPSGKIFSLIINDGQCSGAERLLRTP